MAKYDFEANLDKEFLLNTLGTDYPLYGTIAEVEERAAHCLRYLSIGEIEKVEPKLPSYPTYIFKVNFVEQKEPVVLEGLVWKYDLHNNQLKEKRKIKVYLKQLYDEQKEGKMCCL
jgi:hypothetical protein